MHPTQISSNPLFINFTLGNTGLVEKSKINDNLATQIVPQRLTERHFYGPPEQAITAKSLRTSAVN